MDDTQQYWKTAADRLRESAKWTATVLGAGIAALVGTSPLRGMNEHRPPTGAIAFGIAGLILISITLILVLRVLCPKSISLLDVENAEPRERRPHWAWPQPPLWKWRHTVESEQDLYLPCGITSLLHLRQSMTIEECTLMALSRVEAKARDEHSCKVVQAATTARVARLHELRKAAANVAMIGEYYNLKRRSSWATFAGVICGVAAAACTVAAFAWPLH